MSSGKSLEIAFEQNSFPVSEEQRQEILKDPGFGKKFTDHMLLIHYNEEKGWHNAHIKPYGNISLDPAVCVFHYGQEIFEGLKAYKAKDGRILLFRPEANAKRFINSAKRMAMAPLPEDYFLQAVHEFVKIEKNWIPDQSVGTLYLRPFMIASTPYLGVKASPDYLFMLIASPAGSYFSKGAKPVTVWISEHYTRAAPGGTGEAKCGGNYAASLLAQQEATKNNCDQLVFLDAGEHKWIEEMGGMNIFFVMDDGSLLTPPLGGTILPGVTRNSIITLAKEKGITVREERYSAEQWIKDIELGKIREVFACGTAAVVTPIGFVKNKEGEYQIHDGNPGKLTQEIHKMLVDIQYGNATDTHQWIQEVK
ncbi:branched-chain amino acid aminotransferase [Commensalibacter papalotli (ex Servin-Garciduenas et al. 2014)]|uniref:Branched-chain-amino-acid aminotransferase n=1 Tax=Commensalibacter papalotli (ex Servin-Garciduenas et al. 2014) TaxID=1208583 RepID=W7E6W2_9PROT|nr:branched-chain amino acid aminotransferase [Commensalibacter papalotli (ex Servin-Garciduenas et al. 2014)]EUK18881.1 branched-chain amino acid aminotransferase [Commensalibacter papalotli (ex Servin-Garciduenas et al. 2014)]